MLSRVNAKLDAVYNESLLRLSPFLFYSVFIHGTRTWKHERVPYRNIGASQHCSTSCSTHTQLYEKKGDHWCATPSPLCRRTAEIGRRTRMGSGSSQTHENYKQFPRSSPRHVTMFLIKSIFFFLFHYSSSASVEFVIVVIVIICILGHWFCLDGGKLIFRNWTSYVSPSHGAARRWVSFTVATSVIHSRLVPLRP